ncbi:MAG: hypothetical protein J6W13_07235 [Salinivirgaceae bacterium]|nr:hypothetical protein [Salinivirgaceae bacterium]
MVKQSKSLLVLLFVEGETDEVFFKTLLNYYRKFSTTDLRPYKICNLRGVTRYSSKLLAKLKNEYLPDSKNKGYKIQTVCCTYDTDVFEASNPLMVDWGTLKKEVVRMGVEEFIQFGIKRSIEDWLLCDLEGICKFLKLTKIPKTLNGKTGNEKINNLYGMANKVYQKGYQTSDLMITLNMSTIRSKNKDVLISLEQVLNVNI